MMHPLVHASAAMALIPTGIERTRIERIMALAISDLALDLSGIGVLTEAASGFFSVTPLLAAMAGAAPIVAVCEDSRFGRAADVITEIASWAAALGVADKITFQKGRPNLSGLDIDLVTNLGFVRPIDGPIIDALGKDAAISLMWEPWEFRPADIDVRACHRRGVPIVGTCETHPRLRTYEYLAAVAARILLQNGVEVFGSRLAVIASDPFGSAIERGLGAVAACVHRIDPTAPGASTGAAFSQLDDVMDAVVIAEHRDAHPVIGGTHGIDPRRLAREGTIVVHICGAIDSEAVAAAGLVVCPGTPAPFGKMTVTTAYAGPTPVTDLHAAGLKVGEITVRHRRQGGSAEEAVAAAVASGLGVRVECPTN